MIRKGDILRIVPEWQDAGDDKRTFVARSDQRGDRVDISCLEESHLPIWPLSCVKTYMVCKGESK